MLLRKAVKQAFQLAPQLAAQLHTLRFGAGHGQLIAHPGRERMRGQPRAGKRAGVIAEGVIAPAAKSSASVRHAKQSAPTDATHAKTVLPGAGQNSVLGTKQALGHGRRSLPRQMVLQTASSTCRYSTSSSPSLTVCTWMT